MSNRVNATQPVDPSRLFSPSYTSTLTPAPQSGVPGTAATTSSTGLGAQFQSGRDDSVHILDQQIRVSGTEVFSGASALAMSAIRSGNLPAVIEALADVKDINAVYTNGDTLLSTAAASGHLEIITFLRQSGARISSDTQAQAAGRALRGAALAGDANTVSAWIAAGVDVDAPNKNGASALLIAAQNGRLEVVTQLVEAGAQVGRVNQQGNTALILAALNGHLSVVNVLQPLQPLGQDQAKAHLSQLKSAIENQQNEVAAALIAAGVDLVLVYPQVLMANQLSGYLRGSIGSSVAITDAMTVTIGFNAAGNTAAAAKAAVNHSMVIAAALGKPELTKALHTAGARVPVKAHLNGERALRDAARESDLVGVKAWLNAGINVNGVNQDQVTALMFAVNERSCPGLLEILIEAGADLNLADKDGDTAAMYAAKSGNLHATNVLCNAHADLDLVDHQGVTAIQGAIAYNQFAVVNRLLEGGAGVSASDISTVAMRMTADVPENSLPDPMRVMLAATRANSAGMPFLANALMTSLQQPVVHSTYHSE